MKRILLFIIGIIVLGTVIQCTGPDDGSTDGFYDKSSLLTTITFSTGILEPAFARRTFEYQLLVDNTSDAVTLRAIPENEDASLEIQYNAGTWQRLKSNTASPPLIPASDPTIINVKATTPGGKISTYTITIGSNTDSIVAANHPAYVKNLSIIKDMINPLNDFENFIIDGDYLYIADEYQGLLVYELSYPSPNLVAHFTDGINSLDTIYKIDNYILARDYYTLILLDITDPLNPVKLDNITLDRIPDAIYSAAGNIFISSDKSIDILKIDDNKQMSITNLLAWNEGESYFSDSDVTNDLLYVANYQMISVYTYTTDGTVTLDATLDVQSVNNIDIKGNYCFMEDTYYDTLSIYNVSDLSNIQAVSHPITSINSGFTIVDNYLYAFNYYSIEVYNITDIEAISYLSSISLDNSYNTPLITDTYFLYTQSNTVYISDIDFYTTVSNTRIIQPNHMTYDMAVVNGNRCLIANGYNGLQVFNISSPTNPTLITTFDEEDAEHVVVTDTQVIVSDDYSIFRIPLSGIDSSSTPMEELNLDWNFYDFWIRNNYCYIIIRGENSIKILNIADPNNIVSVINFPVTDSYRKIYTEGNYCYTYDYGSGVNMFTIEDPANISGPVSFATNNSIGCINTYNDYLYIGTYGLSVYDPEHISLGELGKLRLPGKITCTYFYGNYCFAGTSDGAIYIIYIANLNFMYPINSISINSNNGDINALYFDGTYIYAAHETKGLVIIGNKNL